MATGLGFATCRWATEFRLIEAPLILWWNKCRQTRSFYYKPGLACIWDPASVRGNTVYCIFVDYSLQRFMDVSPPAWTFYLLDDLPLDNSPSGWFTAYKWTFHPGTFRLLGVLPPKLLVLGVSPSRCGRMARTDRRFTLLMHVSVKS